MLANKLKQYWMTFIELSHTRIWYIQTNTTPFLHKLNTFPYKIRVSLTCFVHVSLDPWVCSSLFPVYLLAAKHTWTGLRFSHQVNIVTANTWLCLQNTVGKRPFVQANFSHKFSLSIWMSSCMNFNGCVLVWTLQNVCQHLVTFDKACPWVRY